MSNEITDEEIKWFKESLIYLINGRDIETQDFYEMSEKLIAHYESTKYMQWVSVDDRLPEKTCYVDGWHKEGERQTDMEYNNGKFYFIILDHDGDYSHKEVCAEITHWIIPPQPEGEGK